jgi:hypothetical protein
MGTALLKDVDFENGVIEVDIAFEGGRSFAGLLFRVQSNENLENFYIRPHKSNLPDALQYQPIINGSSTWQIYSDEGFTAPAPIPYKSWLHIKMEVFGTQAKIYLNNRDKPALIVTDLKHGVSRGAIGVSGPPNGLAHFSNFRYELDDGLDFEPPPIFETPYGTVTNWNLSQSFKVSAADPESYPEEKTLASIDWEPVQCERAGLVNVSRYIKRSGNEAEVVLAKTTLTSDEDRRKKLFIGYSDVVTVFLNGETLFSGFSEFHRRDNTFLGVMGLNDALYLPLRRGDNELLLAVTESFAGWGFMARDGEAVYHRDGVREIWETEKDFIFPESAVYDPVHDTIYVTNYDWYNRSLGEGEQFLSKVSPDGRVVEREWIRGLKNPTGMALHNGRLYIVERDAIAEIDLEMGRISDRRATPGIRFPNDIAMTPDGVIFVSDSAGGAIFRIANGEAVPWLNNDAVGGPNGLLIHGDQLIVGTGVDHAVKAVDLATKKIRTIVRFGEGNIDGIKLANDGSYLVSHWEGRLYRVTPSGKVTKLLDTSAPEIRCADFDYVADRDLVIIPTMDSGVVKAYTLGRSETLLQYEN